MTLPKAVLIIVMIVFQESVARLQKRMMVPVQQLARVVFPEIVLIKQ